ncbi:MAG: hypothetical protein MRY32_06550 [Rickettsiales bacterium]|nr:hypothetical protein [Rickettsiales bacterium]
MSYSSIGGARPSGLCVAIPEIATHLDASEHHIFNDKDTPSEYALDCQAALIYMRIISEPVEMQAASRATQLSEVSIHAIRRMLKSGRSADDIISSIKKDVLDTREDHKIKMFKVHNWVFTPSSKRRLSHIRVVEVEGGLSMEQLTESDQRALERALTELVENQRVEDGRLSFDENRQLWRFRASGPDGTYSYVYIDPRSIRYSHVASETIEGQEYFVISRRGRPLMGDRGLTFYDRVSTVRISKEAMAEMGASTEEDVLKMIREQEISDTQLLIREAMIEMRKKAEAAAKAFADGAVSAARGLRDGTITAAGYVRDGAVGTANYIGGAYETSMRYLGFMQPTHVAVAPEQLSIDQTKLAVA